MPYEGTKCCWCSDCQNRVSWYHNFCGLFGKVTGSLLVYDVFYPQPENVEAFVAVAQPLVASRQLGANTAAVLPIPMVVFPQPASMPSAVSSQDMAPAQTPPSDDHSDHQQKVTMSTSTAASSLPGTSTSPSLDPTNEDRVITPVSQPRDKLASGSAGNNNPVGNFQITRRELNAVTERRRKSTTSGAHEALEVGITEQEMATILLERSSAKHE